MLSKCRLFDKSHVKEITEDTIEAWLPLFTLNVHVVLEGSEKNSQVFFNPGILYIGPLAFFSINGPDLYYHSYCKCKITKNSKMTQFPVFYETGRRDDSEKYKAHSNENSIRVDSRSIQPMPPESLK